MMNSVHQAGFIGDVSFPQKIDSNLIDIDSGAVPMCKRIAMIEFQNDFQLMIW